MATYNCADSSNSAYGANAYGTCSNVGAPDTGLFSQIVDGGTFTIIAPLVVAFIIVAVSMLVTRRNNKSRS